MEHGVRQCSRTGQSGCGASTIASLAPVAWRRHGVVLLMIVCASDLLPVVCGHSNENKYSETVHPGGKPDDDFNGAYIDAEDEYIVTAAGGVHLLQDELRLHGNRRVDTLDDDVAVLAGLEKDVRKARIVRGNMTATIDEDVNANADGSVDLMAANAARATRATNIERHARDRLDYIRVRAAARAARGGTFAARDGDIAFPIGEEAKLRREIQAAKLAKKAAEMDEALLRSETHSMPSQKMPTALVREFELQSHASEEQLRALVRESQRQADTEASARSLEPPVVTVDAASGLSIATEIVRRVSSSEEQSLA